MNKVRCVKALLGKPCVTGTRNTKSLCPHYEEHKRHQFEGDEPTPEVYSKCFRFRGKVLSGCACGSLKSKYVAGAIMAYKMGIRKLVEEM
jgi:hypothetical protein